MIIGHIISPGNIFVPGGGGSPSGAAPVSEVIVIPADHNSREFNITTIDGIAVADLSFIQIVARGITFTSGGGASEIGLRFSVDGGTTFLAGASDYIHLRYDASNSIVTTADTFLRVAFTTELQDWATFISNLNADMPTHAVSHALKLGLATPKRQAGMSRGSPVAHNAFQLYLTGSSAVFTGGNLDITGYK